MADRLYLKLDGKYLVFGGGWGLRSVAFDYAKADDGCLAHALNRHSSARIVRVRTRSRDDVWNAAIEGAAETARESMIGRGFSAPATTNIVANIRALKR